MVRRRLSPKVGIRSSCHILVSSTLLAPVDVCEVVFPVDPMGSVLSVGVGVIAGCTLCFKVLIFGMVAPPMY
jgi:hypothetical protein